MFEVVHNVHVYKYFAFETEKGIFTTIGTDCTDRNKTLDEFVNIETGQYFTWNIEDIINWEKIGKIKAVKESLTSNWYEKGKINQ